MKKEPLKIPTSKQTPGLRIWCGVCATEVKNFCMKSKDKKEPLSKCKRGDSHSFRAVVYKEDGKRIVRHLGRNLEQAIRETVKLRCEVKGNQQKEVKEIRNNNIEVKTGLPLLIAAARYSAHLLGKRGAEHTIRERSKSYVKSIDRSVVLFAQTLKDRGVNPKNICVEGITQEYIGWFHSYLQTKYENKTYNHFMNALGGLYRYLNKYEGFDIKNPFDQVQKRKVIPKKIETIEIHEFNALLELADDPTKGEQVLRTGEKKQLYFPFNRDFFITGILTGLRREQLVSIRFSDFIEDPETKQPVIISSPNLKVNRIMNDGDVRITAVPVSPQFREYLYNNLNYDTNRGSNKFLIADDCPYKRKTLMDIISKAFSHYWQQLPYSKDKDISFKNLRKFYASQLQLLIGANARFITNQTPQVIDKFYTNRELIAKNASQHNLYPTLNLKAESRQNQLKQIREQPQQQDISKER